MEKPLTVLEFYSGIGGMHYALKQTDINFNVLGAFDINTTANIVYKHNFPTTPLLQKNIQGFTVEYLDRFNADIWTMSPPCQPYTRQGKQEESSDPRAKSFLNILKILGSMENPPRYIFMENVKGFECSDTREMFVSTLTSRNFVFQEFLLSPNDFGIPNSRTRYYLIAKYRQAFTFECTASLLSDVADICHGQCICNTKSAENTLTTVCIREKLKMQCLQCTRYKLSKFVEHDNMENYLLSKEVLLRYHSILDITYVHASRSCCFTKAYGKYIEGTGSVITEVSEMEVEKVYGDVSMTTDDAEKYRLLSTLKLRYFAPREVGNLMCFPCEFSFPDETTLKQKYRVLGNSVNVFVISSLMKWFLFSDIENNT